MVLCDCGAHDKFKKYTPFLHARMYIYVHVCVFMHTLKVL